MPSGSSIRPATDPDIRQELVETLYHVLWELVHVFFDHRGLLQGRDARRVHDTGASSFLYPFLGEQEHQLEPVVDDVRRSALMKADEVAALRAQTLTDNRDALIAAAAALRASFDGGGKLLAFGNGGSATDAMDVVADFRRPGASGRAWTALDLTEDPAILTAIANDIGADAIFSRQVIAHGLAGDVLLAISTSGNSRNVVEALAEARRRGLVDDRPGRLRRRQGRGRGAGRPRDRDPVRAHSAHPGGAGQRLSCAARAGRAARERWQAVSVATLRREQVRVQGTVQGVGFRPYVFRLAGELGLAGFVLNDAHGVLIEVEGSDTAVERFLARLPAEAPPLASVDRVVAEARQPVGHSGFQIVESPQGETADAQIAPDSATCADCLAELFDPHDRRHRYPFVNCTNCGPRFTIVRGVPYDRPQTTMAGFRMCARCQAEYDDPGDRRFHAQPNACPICGPSLSLRDPDGTERGIGEARDAVHAAAAALRDGAIAAIKGIGGYHLACRADDEQAVSRLRARKHREDRRLR